MAKKKYDHVGSGRYDVYKEKKSTFWEDLAGFLGFILFIAIIAAIFG